MPMITVRYVPPTPRPELRPRIAELARRLGAEKLGTNTKEETTAFVKAAYEGMEALLGKLHEECYVLVHAADGDAYGYGGRTQNGRWAAAHPG